jgi:hypothetical protein
MKPIRSTLLAILLALVFFVPVLAQTALSLGVEKAFGYNLGSQIRGTFTLKANGPSDLKSATFLIDGKPIRSVEAAPFAIQIQTGAYPAGMHDLSVTALTASGQTLTAPVRRYEFASAAQEQSGMKSIIIPLLGLVGVIFAVQIAFQFVAYRKRKHEPVPLGAHRNYGLPGGAICPRCGRPTPLHMTGINLGFRTKLDTCENCGRYGSLRVRSKGELLQAEEAELKEAQSQMPIHELTPEEKLKQQVDSSRYEEMK